MHDLARSEGGGDRCGGAQRSSSDERLKLDIRQEPDRVTPMLPALREYQATPGRQGQQQRAG